jgi:hypothetical protein
MSALLAHRTRVAQTNGPARITLAVRPESELPRRRLRRTQRGLDRNDHFAARHLRGYRRSLVAIGVVGIGELDACEVSCFDVARNHVQMDVPVEVHEKRVVEVVRRERLPHALRDPANVVAQLGPFLGRQPGDLFFVAAERDKGLAEEVLVPVDNGQPER